MTLTPEVWDGVLRRLQAEVPSFSYEAWLEPLKARTKERSLVLVCPSAFHRERIRDHYLPRIDACLRAVVGGDHGEGVTIELGVEARRADARPDAERSPMGEPGHGRRERGPARPREARRATRDLPQRPRRRAKAASAEAAPAERVTPARGAARADAAEALPYTFDNFVVGPCNALAREAAISMARDHQRTLSHLYLYAAPGNGKTHLARAVAAEASRAGDAHVRYVSAEGFTNQFLSALRGKRVGEFKRAYRDRGRRQLLLVEDIQFLQQKDATQLEFFHTIQHVLDAGGRLILTSDRLPHELTQLDSRLRSQLMGGFVAELEPPDAQVRRGILRAKAAHGGWRLPPDCLDMLVESVHGSVRDLEGVLIQLVTTAALLEQPIDLALTRSAIERKCPAGPTGRTRLDPEQIVEIVAGFFKTTPARMASRSRKKEVLVPRQLAMYLSRRYTDASVADIGRALGRDHPAVRNAIERVERGILEKPPLRYQVEALVKRIEERLGGAPSR